MRGRDLGSLRDLSNYVLGLLRKGSAEAWRTTLEVSSSTQGLLATFLGGTTALTTDEPAFIVPLNFAGTLTGWKVYSTDNTVGSIAFEIAKATPTYPVTTPDTFTSMVGGGGTKPNLTAQIAQSGDVSGWTSAVFAAGDVLKITIFSASSVLNVVLELEFTKA